MQESVLDYLHNYNINSGLIASRFRMTLQMLQAFVNAKKIGLNIKIDTKLLKTATIDYFVDTARIKEFHDIPKTNTEKIYGYMAYWLLKRKPLQVIKEFPGSEFINELFVAAYLVMVILTEKKLNGEKAHKNKTYLSKQPHLDK